MLPTAMHASGQPGSNQRRGLYKASLSIRAVACHVESGPVNLESLSVSEARRDSARPTEKTFAKYGLTLHPDKTRLSKNLGVTMLRKMAAQSLDRPATDYGSAPIVE